MLPPPPITWTSSLNIPSLFGEVERTGDEGAQMLKKMCADNSEKSQERFNTIKMEADSALEDFCGRFDTFRLFTDEYGRLCQEEVRYRSNLEEGPINGPDDECDCDLVAKYVLENFSRATLRGDQVTLYLNSPFNVCYAVTTVDCFGQVSMLQLWE